MSAQEKRLWWENSFLKVKNQKLYFGEIETMFSLSYMLVPTAEAWPLTTI